MWLRIKAILILGTLALIAGTALAQDDELTLGLQRTFGYAAGSQIQGNFRLEARGPADLQSVTFTLDGAPLASDDEPPFELAFKTDDHPLGWHVLGVTGTTTAGETLVSPPRRFEFVSSDAALRTAGQIVLPLVAIVGLALLVSVGAPMVATWLGRGKPPLPAGAPRNYGYFGGTICPKCGRPFGRHWWGFNVIIGKLDRCDHCGRWSIVQALPRDVLARAEAAELADERARQAAATPPVSDEEKRRRALEESRFDD